MSAIAGGGGGGIQETRYRTVIHHKGGRGGLPMTVSVAGGDVCSEFALITTHLYWPLEELVAVTVRVLLVAVERSTPGAVVIQL